jgi:hypothetical protein
MHRGPPAAFGRPGLSRAPSRAGMTLDMEGLPTGGDGSKARVRVYRFGDHLKQGHAGMGALSVIPNAERTEMDLVKGMLLRAAYGDGVDFDGVDYDGVHIYLLPDGEAITEPGEQEMWEGGVGWGGERGKGGAARPRQRASHHPPTHHHHPTPATFRPQR